MLPSPTSTSSTGTTSQRVGLLAAWGRYPIVVAETLLRQGHEVYCLGVKDHADPVLREMCTHYRPIGVAKLGTAIQYFRRYGVCKATMAGKFHKVLIFKKFYWLKHLPDFRFVRTFYPHFVTQTKDRKDDTLLGTIVNEFGKDGIHFAPATDFAPELLVKSGQLCGPRISRGQEKDIEFGWHLASEMGRLDVGQSVAVKGRAVLAVEAVEGTDECIKRAGKLCPLGGFTLVKIAKPQQDMRFDVPTIGLGTVQTLYEAGGRMLAIEADRTIILDSAEVQKYAESKGISIVALSRAEVQQLSKAA